MLLEVKWRRLTRCSSVAPPSAGRNQTVPPFLLLALLLHNYQAPACLLRDSLAFLNIIKWLAIVIFSLQKHHLRWMEHSGTISWMGLGWVSLGLRDNTITRNGYQLEYNPFLNQTT